MTELGPIESTISKNTESLAKPFTFPTANQLEEEGQVRQNRTCNVSIYT